MNNNVIKSTDENAIERLEAKVAELKAYQAKMVATNKAIRMKDTAKGDAKLKELGYSESFIAKLRTPDFCGRVGFPSYSLQNNNQNIRRLEGRIEEIKRDRAVDTDALEKETDKYRFFVDDDRVQFEFPGKPDEETRSLLKSYGFKWSPSRSTWVRQYNSNGLWSAKYVMEKLDKAC